MSALLLVSGICFVIIIIIINIIIIIIVITTTTTTTTTTSTFIQGITYLLHGAESFLRR